MNEKWGPQSSIEDKGKLIMNRKQIILLTIGAIAIAWALLVPTWESLEFVDSDKGQVVLTNYESRLFNNPPEHSDLREPRIVWRYAIQEAFAYAVVAGILCYFLRTKKTRITDESQEKVSSAAAF
ncbi:MAG: hypothetical protein AMJ65_09225 [Phycisphaerae bacterium SG8_4]|nr:MAG: hypothetical protein AMJ65_09225 [Phycisphaerae bacterium SG8_4]